MNPHYYNFHALRFFRFLRFFQTWSHFKRPFRKWSKKWKNDIMENPSHVHYFETIWLLTKFCFYHKWNGAWLFVINWYTVYELPHKLSSSRIGNFVSTSKNLLKNRNWTFPVVRYFTWKLEFVSTNLWVAVSGNTLLFLTRPRLLLIWFVWQC